MSQFTVSHLQEDELGQTLPLVRMAAPMVTPELWREFARIVTGDGGGILAAFAGDGRPHGIAVYRTERSLIHGRTLRVEPMVTFEISRSSPVRAALCDALESLASASGCDSLLIATGSRGFADADSAKAVGWASLGLRVASVELVKRVEAPAPGSKTHEMPGQAAIASSVG